MKGNITMIQELIRDTVMIQELFEVLFIGLFGVFVVMVIKALGFGDDHHVDDEWYGSPSSDSRDGKEQHERSSRQSKAA
jgi:hypothetical protein